MLYVYIFECSVVVELPNLLVARERYKLVLEHGFDIEPRWAMLVVNETKIQK
jgi:hypothetical protein